MTLAKRENAERITTLENRIVQLEKEMTALNEAIEAEILRVKTQMASKPKT